jgi:RNA polymerase-binding transcription factor DksA
MTSLRGLRFFLANDDRDRIRCFTSPVMGLNLLGIFSALKSFRLYTASTGGKMKQRVEKSHSRSAKSNIQAMAQAASMKQKRRASGNGQDFRSRSFDNLMAKRKEVEEALIRLSDSQRKYEDLRSVDPLIEDVDQAEREISAHRHYSILERKHQELKKIDLLIRRLLEDDRFGRCEKCGRQIPEERLLIVPEAVCCVPCQRELEKWDMKGSIAGRPNSSSQRKNNSGWGHNRQDDDDEKSFTIDSDIEQISLMDFGEIDFEESNKGEKL